MKPLPAFVAAAGLLAAAALPGRAQPVGPPTAVNFASERGVPFGLVLDGQLLAAPVVRQMHLDYLAPGQHQAEFSLPTPAGLQRFQASVWLEPGLETSFLLVQRPGRPFQLRQVSRGPVLPHDYAAWVPGPEDYDQGQEPGQGSYGGNYPPAGPAYPAPVPAPTYPAPGNGYPTPAYPGPAGTYLQPMSPRDVAELAQTLSRCQFDDQRLDIAHQALEHSSLRAVELAALVRTLSFDKSQKELAKFGYAHVADPQNFYRVYDAFTFPLSAREVQRELGLPAR
ncbi:DUF4476 domain-containing protein [Hymenobacter caeli]|uniref:DUF4476 domain-containing protein n=1 Tax=Hymenobacter caeli TaxID=2735894 RepID=A0ABX2FQH4_9BACT|nr:DUF4476 domain-containing protein [Hymenobacter caeli]NRT19256.1 hypothetical protein [Hymenobacter caeli]